MEPPRTLFGTVPLGRSAARPLGRSAGLVMALCAGSAALGQSLKPYRLHVLKDCGGADFVVYNVESQLVPNGGRGTIAISDRGVIGGAFETASASGIYRGFVWFPNDLDLGSPPLAFPQRQILDIHGYGVSLATGHSSFVNDVADNRALVGFKGDAPEVTGEAYVFPLDLASPSIGEASLHTTTGDFSIAVGAKDSTPIEIVGETTIACEEGYYVRPFATTWSFGGGAGTMSILPLPASAHSGFASDVARTGSGLLASGGGNGCEFDSDPCTQNVFCDTSCLEDRLSALRWSSSSLTVLDGLETTDSGIQGRGINPSGDVCGWGNVGTPPNCFGLAAFSNGSSSATFPTGSTVPTGHDESDGNWGEALTPRSVDGCVSIVGMNLTTDAGIVWHGFGDDWCAFDLNDIALPCTHGYQILRAMDINKHRHVTVLVVGPGGTRHLGVLTSAADFDGDLRVDAVDRNDLYANLCHSCSAAQLEYDLNCDGVVTSADMALLVGTYWSGSTKLAVVPPVCACPYESSFSSGLLDEATALAALGFAGWDEFTEWVGSAEPAQADVVCDTLAELIRGSSD